MKRNDLTLAVILLIVSCDWLFAAQADTIETAHGPLKIRPIKHASLMLSFKARPSTSTPGVRAITQVSRRQM